MNLAEENNQTTPRQSIFNYSCPSNQWSQVTPQYMPWGHTPASPAAPLVTFNAQPLQQLPQMSIPTPISFGQSLNLSQPQPSTSSFGQKSLMHCKRKADLDIPVPAKQHITEEKMAAHMSRLHISTESHQVSLPQGSMEDSVSREKRLYVCEEMRRLQTESVLPQALLGRLERPCMAVMLWQPPAKLPELIGCSSRSSSALRAAISAGENVVLHHLHDEDENDNNSTTADLNHMDMES